MAKKGEKNPVRLPHAAARIRFGWWSFLSFPAKGECNKIQGISMGCLCCRQQDWLEKVNISNGARLVYAKIAQTGRGDAVAYPSNQYLMDSLHKTERTIQRKLKELREHKLIASGRIRTAETECWGHVILAHPDLVAWTEDLQAKLKTKVRLVEFSVFFSPRER